MLRLITRNLSTLQIKNPRNPVPPSPNSNPIDPSSFSFVSYLIASCGLSLEKALAAAKKLTPKSNLDAKSNNIEAKRNPDAVLAFFASHGFTKDQISKLIAASPCLLLCSPSSNLKPKVEFYLGAGFSSSDLAKLFGSDTQLLLSSLKTRIIPSFNFLRTILHSDKDIITAVKYTPWLLHLDLQKNMVPNVDLLHSLGVPERRTSGLAKFHADVLLRKTEKFQRMTERVIEMGFRPAHHSFTVALRCFSAVSAATWEAKMAAFKSFGVPEDEILLAFKKQPLMMTVSEQKIKKIMALFVSKLNWKPEYVLANSLLLKFSLERRILPRISCCDVLLSKGLMSDKAFNYQVFWLSERRFFETYVMRFQEEHPQVLEAYLSSMK